MERVMSVVAKYANIDTRRALGFPPRKLSSEWKDFSPRPYGQEIFKYFINTQTLLYYEFWSYEQFYSEITNKIVPEDPIEHKWRHLKGSTVYGIYCDSTGVRNYRSKNMDNHFHHVMTVGWPNFITNLELGGLGESGSNLSVP
jgi:hypothetical protein